MSALAQELYQDVQLMPLLRRLMQISCRLNDSAGGSISIVDSPGQQYTKIAERATACRLGQSFPFNEGVTGRVLSSRRPVVLSSYRDVVAGHLAAGHPAGDGAVAAIPIWWRGDIIGANVVFAGRSRSFSTAEVDQLEIVTQLAASALAMAAERDLSLRYLAAPAPAGVADPEPCAAIRTSTGKTGTMVVSATEAALELAALGESAGVFRSRTGERLYVAVLRHGMGLWHPSRRSSGDFSDADGLRLLDGWRELVESVESVAAQEVKDVERQGKPSLFSPRERQAAALLARGLSDRSVAKELGISQKTVEKHVGAVLRKTGTASRTAAVMHALEAGWLVASPHASEPASASHAG